MRSNSTLTALAAAVAAFSVQTACSKPVEPAAEATPTAAAANEGSAAPAAAAPPTAEGTGAAAPSSSPPAPTGPVGDTCLTAEPLELSTDGTTVTVNGTLLGYGSETGSAIIPPVDFDFANGDRFYAIDVAAGDRLIIDVDDRDTFDSAVYVTRDCTQIIPNIAGGGNTGRDKAATVVEITVPGRYYLAVGNIWGDAEREFTLSVQRLNAVQVAAVRFGNIGADNCAEAPILTAPSWVEGDLSAATDSSGSTLAAGYEWIGKDQFFAIDLMAGQKIALNLNDLGGFDGGLYIARDCANLSASVVEGWDTTDNDEARIFRAPAFGRYFIVVDAYADANAGGPYRLTVSP